MAEPHPRGTGSSPIITKPIYPQAELRSGDLHHSQLTEKKGEEGALPAPALNQPPQFPPSPAAVRHPLLPPFSLQILTAALANLLYFKCLQKDVKSPDTSSPPAKQHTRVESLLAAFSHPGYKPAPNPAESPRAALGTRTRGKRQAALNPAATPGVGKDGLFPAMPQTHTGKSREQGQRNESVSPAPL